MFATPPLIPPSETFSAVSANISKINNLTIGDSSQLTWISGPLLNTFGTNVAINNNIALVGNPNGNTVSVFTYNQESIWSNTATLTPPDLIGDSFFGFSLAITVNGLTQTIAVGGTGDNTNIGAVWIYQNTGSGWTEIIKIIPPSTGPNAYIGTPNFGIVSLVSIGSVYTVAIGGYGDNTNIGAVWIYQSSTGGSSSWTLITKLVPVSYIGTPQFGDSISLNLLNSVYTLAIGGLFDNNIGSVWIYQNKGSGWALDSKLIPPNTGPNSYIGSPNFGTSVSLVSQTTTNTSYTVLIGGSNDNNIGAAWIYQKSNLSWFLITKIIPNNSIGTPIFFGGSVSLNIDDVYTAAIGGFADNNSLGAVWIFQGSGSNGSGSPSIWTQTAKLTTVFNILELGSSVSLYNGFLIVGSDSSEGAVIYTYENDVSMFLNGNIEIPNTITASIITDGYGSSISGGIIQTNSLETGSLSLTNIPTINNVGFTTVAANYTQFKINLSPITLTSGQVSQMTITNYNLSTNATIIIPFVSDCSSATHNFSVNVFNVQVGSFQITVANTGASITGGSITIGFLIL